MSLYETLMQWCNLYFASLPSQQLGDFHFVILGVLFATKLKKGLTLFCLGFFYAQADEQSIFITMQYISSKLYKNLVNSQTFQIIQVKIMTLDLFQGNMIQYGCQTHFQSAKISMKLSISPKIHEIYWLIYFYLFATVLFSIMIWKKKTKQNKKHHQNLHFTLGSNEIAFSKVKGGDYLQTLAILVWKILKTYFPTPLLCSSIYYNMNKT